MFAFKLGPLTEYSGVVETQCSCLHVALPRLYHMRTLPDYAKEANKSKTIIYF